MPHEPRAWVKVPIVEARLFWADVIRVIAVFAVIVLHVAAVPVTHYGRISTSDWLWANAFDSLSRPCIPLLVMLSGALLLTRSVWDTHSFVRKRLIRVAVLFVAWSGIYAVWNYFFHGVAMTVGIFIRHLISGMADPVYSHLWYLPLILSLYLLVPILRIYVINAPLWNQLYFASLWLIASIALPVAELYLVNEIGYYLTPVVGYVGYFILGGTLGRYLPDRLPSPYLLLSGVGFLIGFAVTMIGTYALAANSGKLDEYFYSHLSPSVVVMSISAFIVLHDWGSALEKRLSVPVRDVVSLVAKATLGVYLMHMMVLEGLTYNVFGFKIGPLVYHPVLAIPFSALVIFLLSLLLAFLIARVRPLRWLAH